MRDDISVFAMMRSGHHAIIAWIAGHYPGSVNFLTDVKVYGQFFPYIFDRKRIVEPVAVYDEPWAAKDTPSPHAFIHGYQNMLLDWDEMEQYTPAGKPKRVVVLRDPWNLAASHLRMRDNGHPDWPTEDFCEMWCRFAAEFIRLRGVSSTRNFGINFNQWFSEQPYRRRVERYAGWPISDAYLNDMARTPVPSSFNGSAYDGCAQKSGVLRRWEAYADDPFFQDMRKHTALMTLAKAVYPDISQAVLDRCGVA